MTLKRTDRRRFLSAGIGVFLGSIAGCVQSRSPYAPPMVEDRPEGVYVPSHYEEMRLVGIDESGPYTAGLSYSYPHRFWLVSGRDRTKVPIRPTDSVHLMVTIWDTESGQVISGVDPVVSIEDDSSDVDSRVLWPMLSQRSSFHYGDNVQFDGEGTYRIDVEIAEPALHLVSDVGTRLETAASFSFEFPWRETELDELSVHSISENRQGTEGALSPRRDGPVPVTRVPTTLPGDPIGTGTVGEVAIDASLVSGDPGGSTLVVTTRTPYNRFLIPMLCVEARTSSDDAPVGLLPALDSRLGIHYRGPLREPTTPDWIEVSVRTPTQIARHEGYETAFFAEGSHRFSVPE